MVGIRARVLMERSKILVLEVPRETACIDAVDGKEPWGHWNY